jgi:hypothetical protein
VSAGLGGKLEYKLRNTEAIDWINGEVRYLSKSRRLQLDMSDGPANGPQPRQVILWRSRSNGTVRVSDNYVADGTPLPVQTNQVEASNLPEIASGGDLVVGRPLPLEIRLPREEAPPVLETCPYCFQILPQEEASSSRSRTYSQSWDSESTAAASDAAPRSHILGDLDESRILAVDPLRKKKRTQMLLTRPYFRMLERVAIGDAPSGTSSGPSSFRGTRESSRRGSIDRVIDGDADAAADGSQAFAGMEGYYKRCAEPTRYKAINDSCLTIMCL